MGRFTKRDKQYLGGMGSLLAFGVCLISFGGGEETAVVSGPPAREPLAASSSRAVPSTPATPTRIPLPPVATAARPVPGTVAAPAAPAAGVRTAVNAAAPRPMTTGGRPVVAGARPATTRAVAPPVMVRPPGARPAVTRPSVTRPAVVRPVQPRPTGTRPATSRPVTPAPTTTPPRVPDPTPTGGGEPATLPPAAPEPDVTTPGGFPGMGIPTIDPGSLADGLGGPPTWTPSATAVSPSGFRDRPRGDDDRDDCRDGRHDGDRDGDADWPRGRHGDRCD